MIYISSPEAVWNGFLQELLSLETLLYVLFTVAFFGVIILVLEFLDSTRGGRQ